MCVRGEGVAPPDEYCAQRCAKQCINAASWLKPQLTYSRGHSKACVAVFVCVRLRRNTFVVSVVLLK